MKAVQINKYGGNDVFEINENAPTPILKEGQVLVEVYTASINPFDLFVRSGSGAEKMPLQFPATLGGDFAGVVKQVGNGVTDFKVGDEVFGQAVLFNGGSGSFAEEVASNSRNIALKPKKATFEEAGALPLVGTSAIQALEEHIKLTNGQKILIHGGAGGIGHIAIQLAKSIGAYVATTVSTPDIDFVKSLGVDEVIDYKIQNFDILLHEFDAVYDLAGGEITNKSFDVLKKGGILVSMKGKPDEQKAKEKDITVIGQVTKTTHERLVRLTELVDTGKIKVLIDKVFSLDQIKEAAAYQESHPRGKIVLKMR